MEIADLVIDEAHKHNWSIQESDRMHQILQREYQQQGITKPRALQILNQ